MKAPSLHRTIFTNAPKQRLVTENFFSWSAKGAASAQVACPFFTRFEPIKILWDQKCRDIAIIVKLCEATSPKALDAIRTLSGVRVRYFTSNAFHAKFYIVGRTALIGSANMTGGGMLTNRELSIAITDEDEEFSELPAFFDELWNSANVLTDTAFDGFTKWHAAISKPKLPPMSGVDEATPPTVNVATWRENRERTYLETFRRRYYETLVPIHRKIDAWYRADGRRHPRFLDLPVAYEVDRFLNWCKLAHTTDDTLYENPLRSEDDSEALVGHLIDEWMVTDEVIVDEHRTGNLSVLKDLFQSEDNLRAADFPTIIDAIQGCAAFYEMLRFTKGGLEALKVEFQELNNLDRVKDTFAYLTFGKPEFVQRVYDCIHSDKYRLSRFGENCIFELFGWVNDQGVPPLNGRTIKAFRYLGFDVFNGR
jgi:hypothetical protein